MIVSVFRHRHQRHSSGQRSGLQHHAQWLLPRPLGGREAQDQGRHLWRRGGRPGAGGHQPGEWGEGYSANNAESKYLLGSANMDSRRGDSKSERVQDS